MWLGRPSIGGMGIIEKDPDLGGEIIHPSIDDDSEATDSYKEENNDDNYPKTPYHGENMTSSSSDERNNDENAPEMPYSGENMNASSYDQGNNNQVVTNLPKNDVNIHDNSYDGENDYDVTPDKPTSGGKNGTIDNGEEKKGRRG